jgi:hypothetical protein
MATFLGVSILLYCNDPSIVAADTESFLVLSLPYNETPISSSTYGENKTFPPLDPQKESKSLSKTNFKSSCCNLFPIVIRRRSQTYSGRAPPKIVSLRIRNTMHKPNAV